MDLSAVAPFSSGWSLGDVGYDLLRADLRELGAKRIVEFGAGTSTIHLSHDFPDAEIWSRESHPTFAQETAQAVAEHGGPAKVHVVAAPLEWQVHGGALFLSYAPRPLPREADAVFIDGPPYWTRRGREACLYQTHQVLRVGGRVYLDDYRRGPEQQSVKNWLAAFGEAFQIRGVLESSHRICVLEKTRPTSPPRVRVRRTLDSGYASIRYLISKARGVIPI